MTVSYQQACPTAGGGAFTVLLLKWKGSLYKLIYKELFLFLACFGLLSGIYQQAFNEDQKKTFEQVVRYFDKYLNMIPLSFILGFYVTTVATRWWQQYMALPWPDRLMLCISLYLPGTDEESRVIRWTLLRYMILMLVLVLRSISDSVRNRYPSLQDVVSAGIMTKAEVELYESVKTDVNLFWAPGTWFVHLLRECKMQGRIKDTHGMKLIMEEFLEFRARCGTLWSYDWVSIPLVYTQVVTLATYSFFIACLFGRQNVDRTSADLKVDIYFPCWTVLQFLFYMGLLKVAEQMINPYGEDDEDFELNFLIDRHMKVIRLGADELFDKSPPIDKTQIYNNAANQPNNRESESLRKRLSRTLSNLSPRGSNIPTVSAEVERVNRLNHSLQSGSSLERLIDRVASPARKKSATWKPPSSAVYPADHVV